MQKILFVFVLCIISVGLWGQATPNFNNNPTKDYSINKQEKSGGIDTLWDEVWYPGGFLRNDTIPGGGYLAGINSNSDRADLQFFYMISPFSLTKLLFLFAAKGGSGDITVTIWSSINATPGSVLRRITLPLSAIDTSLTSFTTVNIDPPLSFPENSDFFAGLEYFNSEPGDTLGLYMISNFFDAQYMTFIQKSDSSFASIVDVYGLEASFAVLPVVEYPPVYGNIQGTVFMDNNNNGVKDPGETGIPNQMIKCGNFYATTDANGAYNVEVYSAGQYEIQHLVNGYLISDSASLFVNVNSPNIVLTGNDFPCHAIPGVRDMAVSITPSNFRPGFQSYYWLSCINEGTQIENGSVRITYDNQLTYTGSSLVPDTVSGNTLAWNFTNLTPGEIRNIVLTMETPVSLPLGTLVTSSSWIKPTTNDTLLANNSYSLTHEISGSYDPNDKSVSPVGEGAEGYIGLIPIPLQYTIRFQNTGTDTAFNIVLKDTLDNDLDLSTLRLISSSHPCDYLLSSDRLLTVTYSNILLPDSGTNQKASNGFFKFSVNPKNNLMQGTQLTNYADIYFDLNAPVQTNSVLNTIGVPLGISKNPTKNDLLKIYPNPANDLITVETNLRSEIEIFNIQGQLIKRIDTNGNITNIDISGFSRGMYFVKLKSEKNIEVKKFLKQ